MNSTSSRGPGTPARLYLNGVDDSPNGNLDLDPETYIPSDEPYYTTSSRPAKHQSLEHPREESYKPRTAEEIIGSDSTEVQAAKERASRFLEEMNSPPASGADLNSNPAATPATPAPSATGGAVAGSSRSPVSTATPAKVNPATVPIRTSSRNTPAAPAPTTNGSGSTSVSPDKAPRKHRSMASVPEEANRKAKYPEVDERLWVSQSRQNRSTMSGPLPSGIMGVIPDAGGITGYGGQSERAASSYSHGPQPSIASSSMPTTDTMLRGVGADLISGISLGWSSEKENILKGPFDYLESHPGKDIRSALIAAFNQWLQVPSSSLRIITGVVTMLHSASLLIDDVEDSSQLRRGVPVAHSIFGTAQTINSANYVYFLALQELSKLNNPAAITIYTEELLNLHRGQGMDLFWRDTLTCPSEDDYLEMVGNKTGGLFRLAIKLMCAESPSHNYTTSGLPMATQTDYVPLVNTIGLLFQILDDYKNLSDTTYTNNKGLCEDLTEGKFSFPIIHSIRSDPSNLVLVNILKQKTQDEEVKRYAVAYMEKTGSFAYTRRVLRGLTKKAMQLVDEVDNGRGRSDGIRDVLERLRVEKEGSRGKSVSGRD